MEGRSLSAAFDVLRDKFMPTLAANYMVGTHAASSCRGCTCTLPRRTCSKQMQQAAANWIPQCCCCIKAARSAALVHCTASSKQDGTLTLRTLAPPPNARAAVAGRQLYQLPLCAA